MLLLSMIPAASAFAQSPPSITLKGSTIQAAAGSTVTYVASSSNVANPEYQFWVEEPNGQWIVGQNYSHADTFKLKNVASGDYLVAAYVMSQGEISHGEWQDATTTLADGVFVNSDVMLSTSSTTVTQGKKVTLTAASRNIYDPLYQFWYETPSGKWVQSGNYSAATTFSFTASESGTYRMIAYAKSPRAVNDSEGALSSTTLAASTSTSVSNVTISGTKQFAAGTAATLSAAATDAGIAVAIPSSVVWSVTSTNGIAADVAFGSSTSLNTSFIVPVGDPGTYMVTATVNGVKSAPYQIVAYGQPAQVVQTAANNTVVADGKQTDVITATVQDANGNTVADYNGTAAVAVPTQDASGVLPTNVSFTDGVGKYTITAPAAVPASPAPITLSGLTQTNGQAISYPGLTLQYAAPTGSTFRLTPMLADLSDNAVNADTVKVQLLDQAGHALTAGSSVYTTFTLSGPASFSKDSTKTTFSEYVVPGQMLELPVYSIQGQSGTITLSASASGLTTASSTIQSVVTTAPTETGVAPQTQTLSAPLTVNGVTLPAGWQYTVYTVQTEDASGVAVPSEQSYKISDNTSPEALYYYSYSSAGVGAALSPASITTSSSTGEAQFAVFNTASQTAPATITLTDSALPDPTVTTSFSFYTGAASALQFTTPNSSVTAGESATYAVQVEDAAGNPLPVTGNTVDFWFSQPNASATINGSDSYTAASPDSVTTNSSGVASVTVAIASSAATGSSYTLNAALPSDITAPATVTSVVAPAANYATSMGLSSAVVAVGSTIPSADAVTLPTTMTSGQTLAQAMGVNAIVGVPENAVNEAANDTDTLEVQSSNPLVLSVDGGSSATVTADSGVLPTVTAEQDGTATLTITDTSNPNHPALSATIAVTAGVAAQIMGINPNGTQNSSYTFPVNSGIVGPFTLQVQDLGGNAVPLANGPVTLTQTQIDSVLGLPAGTAVRASTHWR